LACGTIKTLQVNPNKIERRVTKRPQKGKRRGVKNIYGVKTYRRQVLEPTDIAIVYLIEATRFFGGKYLSRW